MVIILFFFSVYNTKHWLPFTDLEITIILHYDKAPINELSVIRSVSLINVWLLSIATKNQFTYTSLVRHNNVICVIQYIIYIYIGSRFVYNLPINLVSVSLRSRNSIKHFLNIFQIYIIYVLYIICYIVYTV